MKSSPFLAILFLLSFALPGNAETPFVLETLWTVADNQWLTNANVALTGNPAGTDLKFPNEIPANVPWGGATVTDGNTIATIIAMPAPRANVVSGLQEHAFRLNMRSNAIVAAAFPNGFQMFRQLSDLYLVSPELSRADIDALGLVEHLFDLQSRTHLGFVQYYPERTLLPTLPPEQEGESDFIKKVRGRSGNSYKEGQYTGTADSLLMGLRVMENNEFRIVVEQRNVAGTPPSNDTASLPFRLGGFVCPDIPFSMAFRVPFGKEFIEDWHSKPSRCRIGIEVIPPEERNDNLYNFIFSTVDGELEEKDGYNQIKDGNLTVFYLKQPEDRPAEDGVFSNEELDKMSKELAHGALPFLANVRESLLSLDWSQPIDLAVSDEDNIWYLALAHPPAETHIDWNLAAELVHTITDNIRKTMQPVDPQDYSPYQIELHEVLGTLSGLTSYRVSFSANKQEVSILYAYEPGIIYAAIPRDVREFTEEHYAAIQQRLEQKIEASRKSIAVKMLPPTTVLRSNIDGTRVRADFETTLRG